MYDAYVGDYELQNIGTIKIVKEGGRLYGKLGNQPKVELFPRSETEFFLKIAQVDIVFNKDPDGGVTSLILKQAGIVTDRKEKNMTYYRVKVRCLQGFWQCIEAVLKDNLKEQRAAIGV